MHTARGGGSRGGRGGAAGGGRGAGGGGRGRGGGHSGVVGGIATQPATPAQTSQDVRVQESQALVGVRPQPQAQAEAQARDRAMIRAYAQERAIAEIRVQTTAEEARREFIVQHGVKRDANLRVPQYRTQAIAALRQEVFSGLAKQGFAKVSAVYADFCLDELLWNRFCADSGPFPFEFMRGGGEDSDWRLAEGRVACLEYEKYVKDKEVDTGKLADIFKSLRLKEEKREQAVKVQKDMIFESHPYVVAGLNAWPYGQRVMAPAHEDQARLKVLWQELVGTDKPLFQDLGYFEVPITKPLVKLLGSSIIEETLEPLIPEGLKVTMEKTGWNNPAEYKLAVRVKPGTIWNEAAVDFFILVWMHLKAWWYTSHLPDSSGRTLYQRFLEAHAAQAASLGTQDECLEEDAAVREIWEDQLNPVKGEDESVEKKLEEE